MAAILRLILGALALLLVYLILWPTPVAPVAWEAPEAPGYVGPFAPNDALADLGLIDLGGIHGPEDVAAREGPDGLELYVSSQVGRDPENRSGDEGSRRIRQYGRRAAWS